MTKATLHPDGLVVWEPPAVYKSSCIMDIEFFPFDIQHCSMKFGSWTYDGWQLDLVHVCAEDPDSTDVVLNGIDISDYYQNVEWDILSVTAQRSVKIYICCIEPYPHITFYLTIRRKTLFHTVTLILPCVVISFLTILVFYLPSDSSEKITLCISILLSLIVFFLLLTEIIPPTSIVIPLIGKYLLFTMILVTLSILATVWILTVHFRSPSTHQMSPWVRATFLKLLPKLLYMRRPTVTVCPSLRRNILERKSSFTDKMHLQRLHSYKRRKLTHTGHHITDNEVTSIADETPNSPISPLLNNDVTHEIRDVVTDVNFICDHLKDDDFETSILEDWKYVAMVLDRMFFWIFSAASIIGTFGILLQAPTLYDERPALTGVGQYSSIC